MTATRGTEIPARRSGVLTDLSQDATGDIAAALATFRRECPAIARIYGFSLCDGASALALFGDGLDGLLMVNPWLVEAAEGAPPAAAVRRHYLQRLTSREGWKKLLTGAIDLRKLARGIARLLFRREDPSLARDIAAALRRRRIPAELILAKGDGTAIAAEAEVKRGEFSGLIHAVQTLDSDSHTFARPGDEAALLAMVLHAIEGWEAAQAS